jgi:hypothetical protein
MALPSKFKYFTGLSAGSYTITIRDAKGCTDIQLYYFAARPMVIEKTVIPIQCNPGSCNIQRFLSSLIKLLMVFSRWK